MNNNAYDVVIIGAGHNGLVAATILARAGHSVLVLEQRGAVGGVATTEEIFPGFRADTGAHDASLFQQEIASELFLPMYGLTLREPPVAIFAPQSDGKGLTLWRDTSQAAEAIAAFSREDARRYPAFVAEVRQMAAIVREMMQVPPPSLTEPHASDLLSWGKVGLQLKRMGDREMTEFMRILPMSVKEYLDHWFESPALKGALGAAGIAGSRLGPMAAGTNLLFLYQHTQGFPGTRAVVGGMGELAGALARAAADAGAEIRTGCPVAGIQAEAGRATGVMLADGEVLRARVVVSNADPRRTLFDLLGPAHLPPREMKQVRNIIYQGSTAKVLLALGGLPAFKGQTSEEQLHGRIRISPSLEYLERAHDDAKYGRISARPYLEMVVPTLANPALAPQGHHLLSVTMQYAPYELSEGNWDERRDELGDLVVDTLAAYAPGIEALIQQRHIITPLDWEQQYGLTEGSIYHGQMGLEQLLVMRPIPGWSRYGTPIKNLYLCGAGTHPGGGVTGAPGRNAAREIVKALRHD